MKLNNGRPTNSRIPSMFVGFVEHFVPASPSENDLEEVTWDRITVYQKSNTSVQGTKMEPKKRLACETSWSEDGLPVRCRMFDLEDLAIGSLQPVGLCMTAMPVHRGTDEYVLTASKDVPPCVYCASLSHQRNEAKDVYVVSELLNKYKQVTQKRAATQTKDTLAEEAIFIEREPSSHVDVDEDSSFEDIDEDSVTYDIPAYNDLDLDNPASWVFPSGDDSSDEEWSDDRPIELWSEEQPLKQRREEQADEDRSVVDEEAKLECSIAPNQVYDKIEINVAHREPEPLVPAEQFDMQAPDSWVFPSTSDESDDGWSSDSDEDASSNSDTDDWQELNSAMIPDRGPRYESSSRPCRS